MTLLPGFAPAQQVRTDPPSPDEAMAAYRTIETWVRDWTIPAGVDLPEVTACEIVLRLGGQIVGRAAATEPNAILTAARQSCARAEQGLSLDRDALYAASLAEAAARLTVSVELAGPFIPITPDTFADITLSLEPGLDGVAARLGDKAAAVFPSRMLSTRTEAGVAASGLAAEVTGDPLKGLLTPKALRDEHGVSFYRFRVTHLAQTGAGDPPLFLHRGGQYVELDGVGAAGLRRFARGMAQNLLQRRWPGPEPWGMLGTLDPCTGEFDPRTATPAEQALAAYALLRFATTPGTAPDEAREAADGAVALLAAMARVQADAGTVSEDPLAAALAVIALLELEPDARNGAADLPALLEACTESVRLAGARDGAFTETLSSAARGPVALAAVRLARLAGDEQSSAAAGALVGQIYRDTPVGELATHLPWLGWAAIALAGDGPIESAVALRQIREQTWSNQVGDEDVTASNRDLRGGIVFSAARQPLPSAQTARPIALLATMLNDRRLTEGSASSGEFPRELLHLLWSLRFLRQLACDEAAGHMYVDPDRAMWGIRLTLWDQRTPADATSLTLLAVTETLRSLASASLREAPD